MIIKYHYYEIYINNQKVESVDTLEEAQTITNKIEEVDNNIKYEIKEINTQNVDEINTSEFEVAKIMY